MVRGAAIRAYFVMTFEFLIACRIPHRTTAKINIWVMLTDVLADVLENNNFQFEKNDIAALIQIRHQRSGDEVMDEYYGEITRSILVGFALELPDEINNPEAFIDEFSASLLDEGSIFHVMKFEDSQLQAELAKRAAEIFTLEMKLRRVLSLIYLHAKQDGDPYDLLRDDSVQPQGKEKPTPDQMRAVAENQFFYLTFGNYVALNQRPEFKLRELLETIRDADTYDKFHKELVRASIEDENDADFLAGLKQYMEPIEKMRNCVAHNRRPTDDIRGNYTKTLRDLDELLDDYLVKWCNEEMPWDAIAREVVEEALERASWDYEARTMTFYTPFKGATVTSLEELREYLEQRASKAFYAWVPYENGKPLFQCDASGIVEAALYDYEDRLAELFERNSTDELS